MNNEDLTEQQKSALKLLREAHSMLKQADTHRSEMMILCHKLDISIDAIQRVMWYEQD